MKEFVFVILATSAALVAGCGPRPVVGGTSGRLHAGGEPLGDMQVTAYLAEAGDWKPIGFADTAADGTFRLLLDGARGPLVLAPGEYRFTLQSVGSPLVVPQELAQVERTPLQKTWTGAEGELDLSLPRKLTQLRRR